MKMMNATDARLNFVPLSYLDHSFVHSLYECSFPPYERRSWEQLIIMLLLPNMQLVVVKQKDEPVGFAVYWQIEGWYFLEHLAVHPTQKGKGFGSAIMKWLMQQSSNKLLLETELPTDEKSQRRIRFYERLNLQEAPFFYQQPPYRRGETTPAMYIMSQPAIKDEELFNHLTGIIRQQVFEAFY
jgi:ribosomal protein S18 acetylase RimI-like enzyme